MAKAFIYYSLSHNGDLISNEMLKQGYEVIKVTTKDLIPQHGVFKLYLKYGFKAIFNKKLELDNFAFNQDNYDEIAIGSPIWGGYISCPINTVLEQIDPSKLKHL